MNKYNVGQFAKRKDNWYEIVNVRFGMLDGKVEYQLCGGGWIDQADIEAISDSNPELS